MSYEDVISFENLYKGLKKSCNNVRWKASVVGYEQNALRNTHELRKDLLNGTYKIGAYRVFRIHEPKERVIVATRIRDRQYQRSLCDNSFYDEITKCMIYDNGACLKGKGIDFCLNRIKIHLHRYYRKYGLDGWVLKGDIKGFFDNTRHDVSKTAVRKRVKDERTAQAVCDIIDSFEGDKGTGLGSQVSQLVQLAVLDDMDHLIKEQLHIKFYVRYMDDFVLVHQSKEYLRRCLKTLREHLAGIHLELNKKTCIYPLKQGIKMLKWRFVLTDTGKVLMLPGKGKAVKIRRKIKKLYALEKAGAVEPGTADASFESSLIYLSKGNSYRMVAGLREFYKELKNEGTHRNESNTLRGVHKQDAHSGVRRP